jgi:hypothetical protein
VLRRPLDVGFEPGKRDVKEANEMAVKALKTNNPAKWPDFAGKDFNGLRPAMRNGSFRHAK